MYPPSGLACPPTSPFFGHCDHNVQFYSNDDFLVDTIEDLFRRALKKGDGAICIATKKHLTALAARFRARDQGMSLAAQRGRYLEVDVSDVLTNATSEGRFEDARIFETLESVIGSTIATLGGGNIHVAVFGEIVAELCSQGKCEEVLRLERLWNRLARQNPISVRCAYPIQSFTRPRDDEYLQMICSEHSALLPSPQIPLPDESDSGQLLAQEQQSIDNNGGTSYPLWQPQYRAAVLESDNILLFKKVEVAQAVVLTRLYELREQVGHFAERTHLTRAWRVLQIIKRDKLGFVE